MHLQRSKKQLLTLSFCKCVCPSAVNKLASNGQIFVKFYVGGFYQNLLRKIQVWLKLKKNDRYFTLHMYILNIVVTTVIIIPFYGNLPYFFMQLHDV